MTIELATFLSLRYLRMLRNAGRLHMSIYYNGDMVDARRLSPRDRCIYMLQVYRRSPDLYRRAVWSEYTQTTDKTALGRFIRAEVARLDLTADA